MTETGTGKIMAVILDFHESRNIYLTAVWPCY